MNQGDSRAVRLAPGPFVSLSPFVSQVVGSV